MSQVRTDVSVIKNMSEALYGCESRLGSALDALRREYISLDWDDSLARVTESILNVHIDAMNTQLLNLRALSSALDELYECAESYTSPALREVQ